MKNFMRLLLIFVVGLMIIFAASLVMYRTNQMKSIMTKDLTVHDKLMISEELLYDHDGLIFKVLDTEIDLSNDSFEINVLFENRTDKAINLSSDLLSVNGIMRDDKLYLTSMPSERIKTTWKFRNHNYHTIDDIRFVLYFYDDETITNSNVLKIKTNNLDEIDDEVSGKLLVDEDVKIIYQGFEKHNLYYDVSLLVDNLSENNLNVEAEVLTINDELYPLANKIEVAKNQRAILNLYLYRDILESLGIAKLDKMSIKFRLFDYYNDEIIYDGLVNIIEFE